MNAEIIQYNGTMCNMMMCSCSFMMNKTMVSFHAYYPPEAL